MTSRAVAAVGTLHALCVTARAGHRAPGLVAMSRAELEALTPGDLRAVTEAAFYCGDEYVIVRLEEQRRAGWIQGWDAGPGPALGVMKIRSVGRTELAA